jgi:hypothetical protein
VTAVVIKITVVTRKITALAQRIVDNGELLAQLLASLDRLSTAQLITTDATVLHEDWRLVFLLPSHQKKNSAVGLVTSRLFHHQPNTSRSSFQTFGMRAHPGCRNLQPTGSAFSATVLVVSSASICVNMSECNNLTFFP